MNQPNIVIAMFDSLAPRYIKPWGDIKFFPAAAYSNAFTVKNCYTAATITLPSVTSMFTGLYPKNHLVTSHWKYRMFQLDSKVSTLAQLLHRSGYQTMLGVSTGFGLDMYRCVGIVKGFKTKFSIEASHKQPKSTTNALKRSKDRIEKEPFFLFLHYFNTHMPYGRAKHFKPGGSLRFKWQDPGYSMERAYVRRVTSTANSVMAATYRFAVSNDAILFVLSDHGEVFISRNVGGHAHWVEQATAHVVWSILNFRSGIDEQLRSLVDLMPTVLGLADIECPSCDGGSVFDGAHDEVYCISEHFAPAWPKISATITLDDIIYTDTKIPEGVPAKEQEQIAARLKSLGYM